MWFQVAITGEWSPWQNKVPQVEVETHKVASPDVVIPTIDTVRHENLLFTWLAEHKPLVLCGPPGSGKTMTLFSALRSLPDMEVNQQWNSLSVLIISCSCVRKEFYHNYSGVEKRCYQSLYSRKKSQSFSFTNLICWIALNFTVIS